MRRLLSFSLPVVLAVLCASSLGAAVTMLKKAPEVPAELAFVRSLDVDTFVERTNRQGLGAQSGRIRFRYLDPDMNAFVGMLAGFHHFNQDMRIGDPQAPDTAGVLANWGGDFGIVRGRHLWELDLEGANLSSRLGFAAAVVGEHPLGRTWILYHRTEVNIFTVDAILDADQGLYWMATSSVGISAGYRWFTSLHMDHSGPHLGVRLYFENPKIPFLFPSLG
jgi:hypothetical protein